MKHLILVLKLIALNLLLSLTLLANETDPLLSDLKRWNINSLTNSAHDPKYYQTLKSFTDKYGAEKTLKTVSLLNQELTFKQRWLSIKRAYRFKKTSKNISSDKSKKIKVIYINGTNTTETYAILTLERIKELIGSQVEDDFPLVEYENFYNFSFSELLISQLGLFIDLQEVIYQSVLLNTHLPYQGLMSAYNRDLKEMDQRLKMYLADGWKVFVVTHSQGGLFANQVAELQKEISPCQAANLQVASPSTFLAFKNADHLTNQDDIVLKIPMSLAGNAIGASQIVPPDNTDSLYHGIMTIYFSSQMPVYQQLFKQKSQLLLDKLQNCH